MIEKQTVTQHTGYQVDWKYYLKWMTPLLVALVVYLLCSSLEYKTQMFLTLTIWAVFSWALEILPEALIAIILSVLYILLGVGKPSSIFAPWTSAIPWLVFGGIIISVAMSKSGLAKRIAYKAISITGTSLPGIIAGLILAGLLITPLISSPSAKVFLFAPIVIGIIQALDIKADSKAATSLMLGALLAVWSPNFLILTSPDAYLATETVSKITGQVITFNDYASHMSIIAVLWSICSALALFIIRPEKVSLTKESVKKQYQQLGVMTKNEMSCVTLFVVMLLLFITQKYHHINPAWIVVMISSLFFFPGINVLQKEDLSKVNFLVMLFIAGAMAIGAASNESGATKLFTETVVPVLQGQSPTVVVLTTWVISVLANFLLTPLAAMAGLFSPIANIFNDLGLNPLVGPYTMILGLSHIIFPYELAPALVAYSFGYIKLSNMIKIMSFRILLGFFFILAVVIPYWNLIGLM